jgi:hypothetical protein
MFALLAGSLLLGGVVPPSPSPTRPRADVVRIADVDVTKGRLTVVRTVLVVEPLVHDVEVERDGRKVKVREEAGVEVEREVAEDYAIKYWRLADRRGKEFDWRQAKGKVVLLYRDNQLPDRATLQLLSKDALVLYGRD